jgi:hypothetical protein
VGDGEEPVQAFVFKGDAGDLSGDLGTEEAGHAHAPPQFIDGKIGVLQRDRGECAETTGVAADHFGEEVILRRRQFDCAPRRRPIAERDGDR